MRAIWTDENKLKIWLQIELLASEALVKDHPNDLGMRRDLLISTERIGDVTGSRQGDVVLDAFPPFEDSGSPLTQIYGVPDRSSRWNIVMIGDGGTGIGGAHLLNAARRNVGLTVLVFNNFNFGCRECHNTVVYDNNTSILSTTLHVNGTQDVSWGPLSTGGGAYNAGACSSIYCHSNGAGTYKPPTNWRTVADGTQGTVGCDYCHKGVAGDFKIMSSNRHYNHVTQSPAVGIRHAAVGCDKCHDLTVGADGKSINAASNKHLSKSVDISFFKFSNRSGAWVSGTKTCNVTYCHGGANPRWSTTTVNNCGSCHAASASTTRAISTTHGKHYNSTTNIDKTVGWDNSNVSTDTGHIFRCGVCHNVYPETDHVSGPVTQNGAAAQVVFNLPAVPAGLPSDLLEKRPDVRQAEQALVAANARIGVAKAQFFPTISLTGLFGWASTELSSLFTGPAQVWSWGGAAVAPIFTGGSLLGQFWASEAIQQQTLFSYQSTVQTAFREVNDALIDQRRTREQLEAQKRQVDSLKEYARIARLRYDNGYTSYIEVLDAERSLFSAELTYAQTQGILFGALVNLYKSMGGGWVTLAEKQTAPLGKEEASAPSP